jgi:hypothetical protein
MKDYNKANLFFLLCLFAGLLVVFFTVVMLTYVGKAGLWSVPFPIAAEGYGLYHLVKLAIKFKKQSEIKK